MSALLDRLLRTFVAPPERDEATAPRGPASDDAARTEATMFLPPTPERHVVPAPAGHAGPAGPAPARSGTSAGAHDVAAGRVAVLARPGDALVAAAAVGLALTQGGAVVVLWGVAAPRVRAPATPSARRLATRLTDRGHAAVALGRLAVVSPPQGIDEALRVAASAPVPAVTAIVGPRDDRVDAVLRAHDRAVAVGDDPVAELAAASVAALDVPARTLALPDAPAARALAAAGVALVAPLREPVEAALR